MNVVRNSRLVQILGTIGVLGLTLTAPSSADISVDVAPAKYELQTQPGKQETFPITVRNTSAAAVHIVASLSDYTVGPTGNYAFSAAGKSPYSLSKTITINPREFDLEPGSFTQVRFSVDVPANAAGEYSNLVFFTTRPTRHSGGGLSIVERIASKIYVMIPETTRIAGEVDDVKGQTLADGQHYLVDFHNTGNAHVYLSGRVEVKQGGMVVDRIPFPQGMLVERAGKRLIDAVGKKLAPGSYSVVAMVDYGGPNLVAGQANITVR
jgi:hypothetical protein